MTTNHTPITVFDHTDPRFAILVQYLHIGRWDARNGHGFRPEYDTWTEDQQRNYERGRFRELGEK